MTDPSEIDVDDLVTTDDLSELENTISDLENKVGGSEGSDDDHDHNDGGHLDFSDVDDETIEDSPWTTPDQARETADQTFMQRLNHLVNEDCDTEQCNEIRDAIGVDPGDGDPDGDDPDADAGDDPDDDEPDESDDPDDGSEPRAPWLED